VQGQRKTLDAVKRLIVAIGAGPPVDDIQDEAHVGAIYPFDQLQSRIQPDHPRVHDLARPRAANLRTEEFKDQVETVAGQQVRIVAELGHQPFPFCCLHLLWPAIRGHEGSPGLEIGNG